MPKPVRSDEYEQQFLHEAVETAARRYGIDPDGFVDAVIRRLTVGQELYANSFMDKDGPQEIREEAQDIGAYSVLEAQKRIALDDIDDSASWHLFEAAIHGAAADWHARQAKNREV